MSLLQEIHSENDAMKRELGITQEQEDEALAALNLTLSDVLYKRDKFEQFREFLRIRAGQAPTLHMSEYDEVAYVFAGTPREGLAVTGFDKNEGKVTSYRVVKFLTVDVYEEAEYVDDLYDGEYSACFEYCDDDGVYAVFLEEGLGENFQYC